MRLKGSDLGLEGEGEVEVVLGDGPSLLVAQHLDSNLDPLPYILHLCFELDRCLQVIA